MGVSALFLAGCRPSPEPVPADPAALDKAAIDRIVAADQKLDRALKEADDLASRREKDGAPAGNEIEAAALLERNALPAATEALAVANASGVTTPWADARKRELIGILQDTKDEIPRYAAALRGTDVDAKLAAIQAEVALEKRTIETVTAISHGPGP
ncbi:MAG: hypothetical protein ABIP39_02645 [Polyangiaceae bacterium]